MKHVPSSTRSATTTGTNTKAVTATLLGFMGLAAIAAAAVGVSDVDLRRIKKTTPTKPADIVFSSASDAIATPPPLFVGSGEYATILSFNAKNVGVQDAIVKELNFFARPTVNPIGVSKKEKPQPGCSIQDIRLETVDGQLLGSPNPVVPDNKTVLFSNLGYTLPTGVQNNFVVKAKVPAWLAPQQHGCVFTFALLPTQSKAMGKDDATPLTLGNGQVVSPKLTVIVTSPVLAWTPDAPVGATSKGVDTLVGKFSITNPENALSQPLTVNSLPVQIQTTIKIGAADGSPRWMKIYKDSIAEANLVTSIDTAGLWKNGAFLMPMPTAKTLTPVTIASGASTNFFVTMDTQDASANDALSIRIDQSKLQWEAFLNTTTQEPYLFTGVHAWYPAMQYKTLVF